MSSERERAGERNRAIEAKRRSFAGAIDEVLDGMGGAGRRGRWVLPIVAGAAGVALALLIKRRLSASSVGALSDSVEPDA